MDDSAGAEQARVFGPERRALTLGILLSVTLFAVDGMGVIPALPTAVRELGGLALFGWAFSAFMLAWLVGTIAAGQLADARGPMRPMALGLLAFAGGLLLSSLAHGMGMFLAGRALQGIGGGGIIAASYVGIARGYPDWLRARIMAIISSVWVLPAVCGPSLSGLIAEKLSWRWVFAGILPLVAVAAVLVLPPLQKLAVHRLATDAKRVPAALRLAVGSGLLLSAPSWRGLGLWASLVAGAVGLLLVIPPLGHLLPEGTFVGRPGLPMGMVARALVAFSFFGTEAFIPLGAGQLRGATPVESGLALTVGALGWVCASWTQAQLEAAGRQDTRVKRARLGFILLALGILVVAAVLCSRLPLWLGLVGWTSAGAGISLAFSTGGLLCIAAAPAERQGEIAGQLQLAEALATSAGTAIGGTLLTVLKPLGKIPPHAWVFALTLGAAVLGALLCGRLVDAQKPAAHPGREAG